MSLSQVGRSLIGLEGRTLLGGYAFSSSFIAGSVGAQNIISLENPAGSGVTIAVARAWIQGIHTTANATTFVYRLRRTTALPTGGTPQTAQKRRTADPTPLGIIRTVPTATGATGQLWTGTPGVFVTAVGANNPLQFDGWPETLVEDKFIFLADSEGLLFSADANVATWFHLGGFFWFELSP